VPFRLGGRGKKGKEKKGEGVTPHANRAGNYDRKKKKTEGGFQSRCYVFYGKEKKEREKSRDADRYDNIIRQKTK